MVTEAAIKEALKRVKGPDLDGDIVSLGMVNGIAVKDGRVTFAIEVPPARAQELEPLRQAAEKVVQAVEGVEKVMAVLTAHSGAGAAAPPKAAQAPRPQPANGAPPPPMGGGKAQSAPNPMEKTGGIAEVTHIVAVASGKGGVGKSTTSVNLALGFASHGLRVGMLDADIYGPSLPRMLGITGKPQPTGDGRTLEPLTGFGLKVMSMGFLVDEDSPMIWRGPMVQSALTQMLKEVAWGDLDVLVIDMPPGTGDAQLTLSQQTPLAGAVIVSTPQDIALIDARKGLNMFRKVEVPVLGIIENMSYFLCPSCGTRSEIFGHGGARDEADKLGVPFLGEVPLHMSIRERSDGGQPIVVSEPDSPHAEIYRGLAATAFNRLQAAHRPAPKIVMM